MSTYRTPKQGDCILGRYRITRKIAKGSMGMVFSATHLLLEREVAIKFHCIWRSDADMVEAFRRESRLTARFVGFPGIIQVFDAGETEEFGPFYVMELVRGPSLQEMLVENGAWKPVDVAVCAKELAQAVKQLHHIGIVHQDIKPANILSRKDPVGNRFILTDFGLACMMGTFAHAEIPGVLKGYAVGTPLYMSKEQAQGRITLPSSDIHAIGMVMLVMLAGQHPYKGLSTQQVVERVGNGGPGAWAFDDLVNSGVPPELVEIVRRAAGYENVYPSPAALQKDLEQFLAGTSAKT